MKKCYNGDKPISSLKNSLIMENVQKPGKRFMTENGNMAVNFHNTFFLMDRLGNYIPWSQTLHHGKLIPQQEWLRIRDCVGGKDVVKELTPFLNRRAATIAQALRQDPLYKMSESQKEVAMKNRADYLNAQAEGVTVEEYLRREGIREERKAKRALRVTLAETPKPIPVRVEHGRTNFFLENVPGFANLQKTFAKTA